MAAPLASPSVPSGAATASGKLSGAAKSALEKAKESIERAITRDAKVSERDLYDRLLKQARQPTDGWLYEDASAESTCVHKRPAMSLTPGGFTQIPAALKQAASQLEYYHSFTGVFPEIHRAWMTIDHILFLWDYTDPRGSFYQYDGLDQAIITAAVVRPRPGVFDETATPPWLLLLSTPIEVVVLGLCAAPLCAPRPSVLAAHAPAPCPTPAPPPPTPAALPASQLHPPHPPPPPACRYTVGPPSRPTAEIELHETGFAAPADGSNILSLKSTPQGRVFMAGADGFIYELQYGSTQGWLDVYRSCAKRNRSRKRDIALQFVKSALVDCADPILDMNIDCERFILYTLSKSSTVQMYDLGAEGDGFAHVASMTAAELLAGLSKGPGRDSDALRQLGEDVKASIRAAEQGRLNPTGETELINALVSLAPVPSCDSQQMQVGSRVASRALWEPTLPPA